MKTKMRERYLITDINVICLITITAVKKYIFSELMSVLWLIYSHFRLQALPLLWMSWQPESKGIQSAKGMKTAPVRPSTHFQFPID